MTALYIILGILVFFALLLCCPITVKAHYGEEFTAVLSYLVFRVRIPAPEKPEKKKKKKKSKQPEKAKPEASGIFGKYRDMLKKKGLSGLLELLSDVARELGKAGKKFSHTMIRKLSVQISVAGGDAADTAVLYGKTCAVVYPAVAALLHAFRYRTYRVEVQPDFTGEKTRIDVQAELRLRAVHVVSAALGLVFGGLKIFKKLRQDSAGLMPGVPDSESE